tara:strand:+ start:2313 stop:2528 length:216 start_codon:yes stop_codon:yes gene_type:complete
MKLRRTKDGTISFFDNHGSITGYYLDKYNDNTNRKLEVYCKDTTVNHGYVYLVYHDNFREDDVVTCVTYNV